MYDHHVLRGSYVGYTIAKAHSNDVANQEFL